MLLESESCYEIGHNKTFILTDIIDVIGILV